VREMPTFHAIHPQAKANQVRPLASGGIQRISSVSAFARMRQTYLIDIHTQMSI
jgi:hypothetical protein